VPAAKERAQHIVLRPGSEPLKLKPGDPVSIGRSAKCALTIPSQRVSRHHAEITWEGSVPILRDLGSQNRSRVNGKPVSEHRLEDRDEISIGPYSCTYRKLEPGAQALELTDPDSNASTLPSMQDAISGIIDALSLRELLQSLAQHRKSGTLEVFDTESADGRIVLQEGEAVFAESGAKRGEAAIRSLLQREQGMFRFEAGGVPLDLSPNLEGVSLLRIVLDAQTLDDQRLTRRQRFGDLGDLGSL